MTKIAQLPVRVTVLNKSGVEAKLWPNGEIAFHLPKRLKEVPQVPLRPLDRSDLVSCLLRSHGVEAAISFMRLLGLSSVPNFDKTPTAVRRSGSKGITSLGRRRVRNAAYLLTREHGKHCLTFATVTLPALLDEDMATVHTQWHKVIDRYRLLLSRQLRRGGLTGEVVGVTEVQEQRYANEGFPVLHGHFVFVGRGRRGGWVLTTARHDYIWRKSLNSVLRVPLPTVANACQLKCVQSSAEGYLGKYMSKGGIAIANIVTNGYEWALPKQWWSCSRSLVRRMGEQMRFFTNGAQWLISKALERDADVWAFYSVVTIVQPDGAEIDVGSYGRLTPEANGRVRRFLGI